MRERRIRTVLATALSCAMLAGCHGGGGLVPAAPYGALESSKLSPQAHRQLALHISQKIKYVFILFQENHSFDNYFGTFPGAENLGTPLARSHGYRQYDMLGRRWQTVFKTTYVDLPAPNHDRSVLLAKFDASHMDAFISAEEQEDLPYGG